MCKKLSSKLNEIGKKNNEKYEKIINLTIKNNNDYNVSNKEKIINSSEE